MNPILGHSIAQLISAPKKLEIKKCSIIQDTEEKSGNRTRQSFCTTTLIDHRITKNTAHKEVVFSCAKVFTLRTSNQLCHYFLRFFFRKKRVQIIICQHTTGFFVQLYFEDKQNRIEKHYGVIFFKYVSWSFFSSLGATGSVACPFWPIRHCGSHFSVFDFFYQLCSSGG